MSRAWCAAALLVACGCRPVAQEDKALDVAPRPASLEPPAAAPAGSTPPVAGSDAPRLLGKWSHTLADKDGQERLVILEYVKDQDGRERFEFLQHPWPAKPVFTEQIKPAADQSELRFKLVDPAKEAEQTPGTLRYILKEEQGTWRGQLFESWSETPHAVVLTKSD